MGDEIALRRLVEMLSAFYTEGRAVEEDLSCSLSSKFLRNTQDVLFTKQIAAFLRWQNCLKIEYQNMVSSLESFLVHLFSICKHDNLIKRHVFERLLNAFALILCITKETCLRKEICSCKLVPDIFMVFYEETTSLHFRRRKGFRQFVEYINNPKYLESHCVERNISSSYAHNVSILKIPKNLHEKAQKMTRNEQVFNLTDFQVSIIEDVSSCLKDKVLEIYKTKFAPCQIDVDLKASLDLIEQKKIKISESLKGIEMLEKKVDKVSISERPPRLKLDPEANDVDPEFEKKVARASISERPQNFKFDPETNNIIPGQIADSTRWVDKVVEAVMKCQNSKSSSLKKTENHSQTEVDRIMVNLESKIGSLIEVLDKFDKE